MTFIVTKACDKCKYTDCVEVCPVDCFHEDQTMLLIDPVECVDCGACIYECPVNAIYAEDDVPPEHQDDIKLNYEKAAQLPVINVRKEALAEYPPDWKK